MLPGNTYHLEFTFAGNSNQNFYYMNLNQTWSQDGFSTLDGTYNNSASNSLVAAFRVNANAVSDTGSTAALLGAGVVALAFARRRLG